MRCSESWAYSLFGYCSTTVLKAAKDLRAVLGGRLVRSARNRRSIAFGVALEVHQPLDVPGVVDARVRRVLADEGVGRIGRGLALAGAVVCVDQVQARLAGLVGEREARGQALVGLDGRVEVVGLRWPCAPSCRARRGCRWLVCPCGAWQQPPTRRAGRHTGRARRCAPDGTRTSGKGLSVASRRVNPGKYSESPGCTSDRGRRGRSSVRTRLQAAPGKRRAALRPGPGALPCRSIRAPG